MKLFIWQGNRISTGYHDDGSLVVLAETVEDARRLARENAREFEALGEGRWDAPEGEYWTDGMDPYLGIYHDDTPANPALDREPDRIVELTEPRFVLFNGGGYD